MITIDSSTVIYTIIPITLMVLGAVIAIRFLYLSFSDRRERKEEIKRLSDELKKSKLLNRKLKELINDSEKRNK